MAKFVVLYRSSMTAGEQMSSATPEQAQEGMQLWMRWAEKAGPALVDLGSPLGSSQTIPSGAESGVPIAGYSVLQGDSTEAVTSLLEDHPHLQAPGAVIEVLECLELPGM